MRSIIVFVLAIGAAMVCAPALLSRLALGGEGFPEAATYNLEKTGAGGRTFGDIGFVDASSREKFEALVAANAGSNCRDKRVSIGADTFDVAMTCDASDGDIHNISIHRHGSYSKRSIKIEETMSLWGQPIHETRMYTRRWGKSGA